jgi:hypothetical protein
MAAMLLAAPKPAHATTFTVTNTNDSGAGSLRQAIDATNANAGADAIKFNIPGNEVKTISPASALPDITDTVAIDGYTQPGTEKNTLAKGTIAVLKIELNGENAGNAAGLQFDPPSGKTAAGSVVRGLSINRFDGPGILLQGGVRTSDLGIEGNFLGTDPGGTEALGNGDGVNYFAAVDSTIGGSTPDKRNLISGNDGAGVSAGNFSARASIEGNLIGTKKDGYRPWATESPGCLQTSVASPKAIPTTLWGVRPPQPLTPSPSTGETG